MEPINTQVSLFTDTAPTRSQASGSEPHDPRKELRSARRRRSTTGDIFEASGYNANALELSSER